MNRKSFCIVASIWLASLLQVAPGMVLVDEYFHDTTRSLWSDDDATIAPTSAPTLSPTVAPVLMVYEMEFYRRQQELEQGQIRSSEETYFSGLSTDARSISTKYSGRKLTFPNEEELGATVPSIAFTSTNTPSLSSTMIPKIMDDTKPNLSYAYFDDDKKYETKEISTHREVTEDSVITFSPSQVPTMAPASVTMAPTSAPALQQFLSIDERYFLD